MNRLVIVASAMVVAGCAFNPETMPVMERDQSVYVDKGAPKRGNEVKARVAVVVSLGEYKQYAAVGRSLSSSLCDKISKFAFFDLVDRESTEALLQEKVAGADDPTDVALNKISSDFVVIAKLTSIARNNMGVSSTVDAQFDFSWISMGEDRKVILKKNIRPTVAAALNTTDENGVLCLAAEKAALEFTREIASKYAPPARVLQTRGNGAAARISIGQDYGLDKNMEVEFYEIVDNSDMGGSARDNSMIGRGVVRSVEAKAAWVEVLDFDKVNVRRGVYVRIIGMRESVSSRLIENSGINNVF